MENEAITLSIIIPVYNSSRFLDECLSSLEKQTASINYEAIVSYDLSEDDSLSIIGKHMETNPNIKLLKNKERLGILIARTEAIKISTGEYVTFLDSDDYFLPNAFEEISKVINKEKPDIASFSFYTLKNNKIRKYPFAKNKIISKDKAFAYLQSDISFRGFLWQKIFKRSLFEKRPLLFISEKNAMFEDNCLVFSLIEHSNNIVLSKNRYYVYREDNSLSGTTVKRIDRLDKHILCFDLEKYFARSVNDSIAMKTSIKFTWRNVLSLKFDAKKDASFGGMPYKEAKRKIKQWEKEYKSEHSIDSNKFNKYFIF